MMWLRFHAKGWESAMRYPGFDSIRAYSISTKPSNWITTVPCSLLSQSDFSDLVSDFSDLVTDFDERMVE
jgi:hypothetical protein